MYKNVGVTYLHNFARLLRRHSRRRGRTPTLQGYTAETCGRKTRPTRTQHGLKRFKSVCIVTAKTR